jgi:hypothetical protein
MAIKEKLEEKIHRTEKKLKELSIHIQRLDHEYQLLLKEWSLTPKQIQEFAENPANFDPSVWEQLQKEQQERDEKLNLELNNVHDANKTKQVFSDRGKVQQHWMYVR